MIIHLQKFIQDEQRYWRELEQTLDEIDRQRSERLTVAQIRRLHCLYERVSSDLGKVATFSAQPDTRRYLEGLVARAYGEIHETRALPHRFRPFHWFLRVFPATFRRHGRAFSLSVLLLLGGATFGGLVIALDPSAREILLPYDHLLQPPAQRVAKEERTIEDRLAGAKTQGAAWYIRHNTQVAIAAMALGVTWGVGTVLALVVNGIMLGAVATDYALAGETTFLLGWLLPHGVIEIPAILLAGQAGLVLAGAMIGWERRVPLRPRLRQIGPDLVTLIGGVAVLLAWAGIVEAFLSQYHEPVLPYSLKIAFGLVEAGLLAFLLGWSGRRAARAADHERKPA